MNRLKNGTFCVLPFIEEFQDVNGNRKFCCYSKELIDSIDSHDTNKLRQKILAGESIPHCQSCYNQEKNKVISPRLKETARWLRDPEVKQYIDQWEQNQQLQTFFYDLRVDNKCNLACISCGPLYSSLWAKELEVNSNNISIDYDLDKLSKAKMIYLAGGEPLIIDQFNSLLEAVAQQEIQPEIVINTNLTRINDNIASTLKKIKKLTLTISVDAFGSINEYHRWPMSWDKFMRNLEWARSIGCTIQFNSVIDSVSIWNIDQLIQIEHIADFWTLTNLVSPAALCINNLSIDLKPLAITKFEQIKRSRFYTTDPIFRSQVDAVINNINQPGDPDLLSMYITQIDQRRQINHFEYIGTKLT